MKFRGGSCDNSSSRGSSSRDGLSDGLSERRSSSASTSDMEVVTSQLCDFPQPVLLQEGIKACDFCPYCRDLGSLCAVSLHRALNPRPGSYIKESSPGREYPVGTLSPRGVIRQMQLKYRGLIVRDEGLEVSTAQRCRNSQQNLLSRGTNIADFCPLCKLHGVLCAVSVHRKDQRQQDDDIFSPLSPRGLLTPRSAINSAAVTPREYIAPRNAVLYMLCDSAVNGDRPLSTAFAVSNKYLLSNQTFMNGKMRTSYSICKSVKYGPNGEICFPEGRRAVKIRCFNEALNYSLLELQDEPFNLVPIESLSLDDMLDQMDLDPEDSSSEDNNNSNIRDLAPSEFRTKIRNLSFL